MEMDFLKNKVTSNWLLKRPVIFELIFPAIVFVLGLQSIRVLVSSLTWTLGDRLALGAPVLGLIALGVFCPILFAGFIKRFLGIKRAIIITAASLGCLRFLLQPVWVEPLVNTGLSMLATMAFIIFIPLYVERAGKTGKAKRYMLVLGLLLGLALDSALYGVYGTYDIAWNTGFWSVLFTLFLATSLFVMMFYGQRLLDTSSGQQASNHISSPWPLIAIGPFIFLQLQVFQNVARLTAVTEWEMPLAFSWIMLGHLLGITFTAWFVFRPPARRRITLCLLAIILLLSTIFPAPTGLLAGIYFLLGQVSLSILIYFIILHATSQTTENRNKHGHSTAIATGIGVVLMAVFILGYYATYQIKLPIENHVFEPLAAFIVTACVIPLGFTKRVNVGYDPRLWLAPATAIILLLFSFASMVTYQKPMPVDATDSGLIKVMCYNLHNGFNTRGHLDMEALAENIEALDPDIVALQEISRGWLVNGRLDMIEWLSVRLDMPYVYGATAGPMWGNAILSRFEITDAQNHVLPSDGLPIKRGFIHAEVRINQQESLGVIATHFHHVEEDSLIRQNQASSLLEYVEAAENIIIMGDLNAITGAPEIEMFKEAGFVDVVSLIEPPAAYTFHADNPYQRIDYIWMSPEMEVSQITVHQSTASDHLAIFAVITP